MKQWFNICTRLLLVICLIFAVITFRNLRNTTYELNSVVQKADSLRQERDTLIVRYSALSVEFDSLHAANARKSDALTHLLSDVDSLRAANDSLKKELLNVPDDTIYIRMQDIAPTNLPLVYPFSGSQIRFYYSSYIDAIGNRELLKSQENALNSCVDYSRGLGMEIAALASQNGNLSKQLTLADMQTGLYKDSAEKLTNKLSNVKKREKIFTVAGLVVGFLLGR